MTPKEKAEALVDKMLNNQSFSEDIYDAKQCALIAVDEIIEQCKDANFGGFGLYWQEVKQEIINL
jgi:hypothetical protein